MVTPTGAFDTEEAAAYTLLRKISVARRMKNKQHITTGHNNTKPLLDCLPDLDRWLK